MTTTVASITRSGQDRFLSAVDTTQTTATNAVSALSDAVRAVVPEAVRDLGPLPGRSLIPSPHEAVELTWGFAEQLVQRQRTFADGLVDASGAPEPGDA